MNNVVGTTVATVNDQFRQTGFGVTMTSGVQAMPNVFGLVNAIRAFNKFTEDNDPYGEHDFGSLMWHGEKVFWKIDYYDQALEYGIDPLAPECRRVMTIMLAGEY